MLEATFEPHPAKAHAMVTDAKMEQTTFMA
jgi:hypothetical protein